MKILPLLLTSALVGSLAADTVYTIPQGYTKVTISGASAVGEKKLTAISATLLQDVEYSGALTIGSFNDNPDPDADTQSASVSGVTTWAADEWTSVPHLAYVTEADDLNNADGEPPAEQAFLIMGNTTNGGLTLAATSDMTVNFPANSTVKIRKANTLSSIFASGVQNVNENDRVFIWDDSSNSWVSFNYIPDGPGLWIGPAGLSNDMVVFPEEGLFYSRTVTTDLELTLFGEVPAAPQLASIEGSGFLSSRVPVNSTIGNLGVENSNWNADFDRLYVWKPDDGDWDSYNFIPIPGQAGLWLKGGAPSNDDVVAAGSAVFLLRQTENAAGTGQVKTELPYNPFAE